MFLSADIEQYVYKFERLLEYIENGKTLSETAVCSMFSDILYSLISDCGGGQNARGSISGEVIRYLDKHFNEKISIENLSRELYLSPAHLIRRFKAESGYTPYEYLGLIRLTKACRLLEFTDLTVKEIAEAVGMAHTGRFIAKFKEYNGTTPAAYRREINKERGIIKKKAANSE